MKSQNNMKFLLACALAMMASAYDENWVPPTYTEEEIKTLQGKTCLNIDEVAQGVGFTQVDVSPYPESLGYDTVIPGGANSVGDKINCYVHYVDDNDDSVYRLESWTEQEAVAHNSTFGSVFMTHSGGCGVCSDLENLAAYIITPDMTKPLKTCGLLSFEAGFACAQKQTGLQDRCQSLWWWNVMQDKKKMRKGGCLGVCLAHLAADSNDPGDFPLIWGDQCLCGNTVNGGPACSPLLHTVGSEYKLNACLACDECRAGPVFQKIAARFRRNSGLSSAIKRPPGEIAQITHYYGKRNRD